MDGVQGQDKEFVLDIWVYQWRDARRWRIVQVARGADTFSSRVLNRNWGQEAV